MDKPYNARLVGIEHYWTVIKATAGQPFTVSEIAAQTQAHVDSVGDYVRRLVRGGYVAAHGWVEVASEWRPTVPQRARTYRLVKRAAAAPSLRRDGSPGLYGLGRQQMWNILRGSQATPGIDATNLQLLASTDVVPISLAAAKDYLKTLHYAGYLAVLQPAANHRLTVYRLVRRMNTGPLAPLVSRTRGLVIDRNRGEVVSPVTIEDVP